MAGIKRKLFAVLVLLSSVGKLQKHLSSDEKNYKSEDCGINCRGTSRYVQKVENDMEIKINFIRGTIGKY